MRDATTTTIIYIHIYVWYKNNNNKNNLDTYTSFHKHGIQDFHRSTNTVIHWNFHRSTNLWYRIFFHKHSAGLMMKFMKTLCLFTIAILIITIAATNIVVVGAKENDNNNLNCLKYPTDDQFFI